MDVETDSTKIEETGCSEPPEIVESNEQQNDQQQSATQEVGFPLFNEETAEQVSTLNFCKMKSHKSLIPLFVCSQRPKDLVITLVGLVVDTVNLLLGQTSGLTSLVL